MVAFLDCLQQFAGEVERRHGFSLPYEMDKGKIRDNNTGQVSVTVFIRYLWHKLRHYHLTYYWMFMTQIKALLSLNFTSGSS